MIEGGKDDNLQNDWAIVEYKYGASKVYRGIFRGMQCWCPCGSEISHTVAAITHSVGRTALAKNGSARGSNIIYIVVRVRVRTLNLQK